MFIKFIFVALLFSFLLLPSSAFAEENYQIISSPTGNIYRLNTENGELFVVTGRHLIQVKENIRTKIHIGEIFETEEGETYNYLGKGKFEPKPLSSFTDEELLNELNK